MFSELRTGDVVILPFFPHIEDRQKGEARCVIILEKFDDGCSIVPLTCQNHQNIYYVKHLTITQDSVEGKQMGLICDSLIIVDREILFPKVVLNKIIEKRGECPDDILDQIHALMNG
jgi:hypothetical protein